jgi:pimeloyl-ACP methyl ester carboxylesterase
MISGYDGAQASVRGGNMGKGTSQGAAPTEPKVKKKRRSLLASVIRILAIALGVFLVLFLVGGWIYSGDIETGALAPPTNEPPDYDTTITGVGSSLTMSTPADTGRAGEDGRMGIEWPAGYAQTTDLVSSTVSSNEVLDVRALAEDADPPAVGTKVRIDNYYRRGDPAETLGVPYDTVFYASNVGSFPAWFIEGTEDTWAIIVHGKGASLDESTRVIKTFQDLGYPVLIIKYRNDVGEPRDPSGYMQYGVTEWVDLSAAVLYAQEHGAAEHVLFGYSYGGAVITSYLTQSPLRNFTKAAILDSPVYNLERTVDYAASLTDLPLVPIKIPPLLGEFAKWIASWRFDLNWDDANYLAKSGELHAPTLVFHGTNDLVVPYETSRDMQEIRPDITTLVTTSAGHTSSWNLDPEGYDATIKDFLANLG